MDTWDLGVGITLTLDRESLDTELQVGGYLYMDAGDIQTIRRFNDIGGWLTETIRKYLADHECPGVDKIELDVHDDACPQAIRFYATFDADSVDEYRLSGGDVAEQCALHGVGIRD